MNLSCLVSPLAPSLRQSLTARRTYFSIQCRAYVDRREPRFSLKRFNASVKPKSPADIRSLNGGPEHWLAIDNMSRWNASTSFCLAGSSPDLALRISSRSVRLSSMGPCQRRWLKSLVLDIPRDGNGDLNFPNLKLGGWPGWHTVILPPLRRNIAVSRSSLFRWRCRA